MKSSILRNYLNKDGYSQNLISRQEEIDRVLIDYVNVEWGKQKNKKKDKKNLNILNILNILKLTELRRMINLEPTPKPIPIFRDILEQSNQMVLEWGEKCILFTFLNLQNIKPAMNTYIVIL